MKDAKVDPEKLRSTRYKIQYNDSFTAVSSKKQFYDGYLWDALKLGKKVLDKYNNKSDMIISIMKTWW